MTVPDDAVTTSPEAGGTVAGSGGGTPLPPSPTVASKGTVARKGGGPRRVTGVVVGNKADKTARVRVERRVKHPLYGKIIRRRGHLQAHDPENKCAVGDVVTVEESPRVSKTKCWRVVEIAPGSGL